MRVLEYSREQSPRERGRMHGESFRGEIASLAAIRVHLAAVVGRAGGPDRVLALAERHLPVLEAFDRDLYEELCGIAEGAACSPAEIVVLNHYTDLRDVDPEALGEQGCSVLYARTPQGPVLAQTWDMHATAIPYVMMLRTPDALLLSLTGCLGMAGMSAGGVAVAINNLHSTDARVGVVWPALVRALLSQPSAEAARDLVLGAEVGSGHHYLVAGGEAAFGVETSGTERRVVYRGEAPWFVHTNHCVDAEVAARSRVPAGSTTRDRYGALRRSVEARPVAGARDAYDRLGSHDGYPRSVCTNMATPENPHGPATCAGLSMDLARRELLAVAGFTHNVEPARFEVPAR